MMAELPRMGKAERMDTKSAEGWSEARASGRRRHLVHSPKLEPQGHSVLRGLYPKPYFW